MDTLSLDKIIDKSLEKAMSYQEYRTLITNLLEENKSTAPDQDEELTNYSRLNQSRMKRWDKTLKITPNAKKFFEEYNQKVIWLVISEGWCGDAAHALPVLNALAELNPNIELKIVLRDQNEALMYQFLTNGGKSIPKVIMLKAQDHEVFAEWGPRPCTAVEMTRVYKIEHDVLDAAFKEKLHNWYNADKGQTIIANIMDALQKG